MRRVAVVLPIVAVLTMAVCAGTAQASVLKADNTTALNVGASWVGGGVPATTDVVEWNSTVTAANATSTGGTETTWGGIKITNPGGAVTISNSGAGNVNLGASGIDMSAATQDFTMNFSGSGQILRPSAQQTWTVASGRTLTINGAASNTTVTFAGAGDISLGAAGIFGYGQLIKNSTGKLTSGAFGSGRWIDFNAGAVQLAAQDAIAGVMEFTVANGVTVDTGNYMQTLGHFSGSDVVLKGGTLSGNGAPMEASWGFQNKPIKVMGGVNTSAIRSENMLLWSNTEFNVAAGAANGIDLDVTGWFQNHVDGTNAFTKTGDGVMRLAGENRYMGNTTVSAGTLLLDTPGSLMMDINPSTNTQILGVGTLILNGTINLDVADITAPGSWSLIDVARLTETYGPDFAMGIADGAPFTESGNIWTGTTGSLAWKFTESTGVLAASPIPEPSTLILSFTSALGLLAYARRKRK